MAAAEIPGGTTCGNCDEPATRVAANGDFYCEAHIQIQFKEFCEFDDVGDRCWEFKELGWITWAEHERLDDMGRQDIIQFIEQHEGFDGWRAQCPGCRCAVENCQNENEECVGVPGEVVEGLMLGPRKVLYKGGAVALAAFRALDANDACCGICHDKRAEHEAEQREEAPPVAVGGGGGGGAPAMPVPVEPTCCSGGDVRGMCFFTVDRDHLTEADLAKVLTCPRTPDAVSWWLDNEDYDIHMRAMAGNFSDLDTLLGGRLPSELKEAIKRTYVEDMDEEPAVCECGADFTKTARVRKCPPCTEALAIKALFVVPLCETHVAHLYHRKCLKEWLKRSDNNKCPMCQAEVVREGTPTHSVPPSQVSSLEPM